MVADDLLVKRQGEQNLDMYLLMLAHLVSKVRLQNQYLRVPVVKALTKLT